MDLSVLVMAKAPRAGTVKTRLEPLLGPAGCARLQGALIAVITRWAAQTAPGAAYLAYGPDDADDGELRPHAAPGVELLRDGSGDLGDRLAHATARVLARHPERLLLVVGTDMPTLGAEHARAARAAFGGGADLVFGPAHDGGYWLVGLRRATPEVFALGAAWGGPTVLELSLTLAERAGLRSALLAFERDLDDPDDAQELLGDPRLPSQARAALAP